MEIKNLFKSKVLSKLLRSEEWSSFFQSIIDLFDLKVLKNLSKDDINSIIEFSVENQSLSKLVTKQVIIDGMSKTVNCRSIRLRLTGKFYILGTGKFINIDNTLTESIIYNGREIFITDDNIENEDYFIRIQVKEKSNSIKFSKELKVNISPLIGLGSYHSLKKICNYFGLNIIFNTTYKENYIIPLTVLFTDVDTSVHPNRLTLFEFQGRYKPLVGDFIIFRKPSIDIVESTVQSTETKYIISSAENNTVFLKQISVDTIKNEILPKNNLAELTYELNKKVPKIKIVLISDQSEMELQKVITVNNNQEVNVNFHKIPNSNTYVSDEIISSDFDIIKINRNENIIVRNYTYKVFEFLEEGSFLELNIRKNLNETKEVIIAKEVIESNEIENNYSNFLVDVSKNEWSKIFVNPIIEEVLTDQNWIKLHTNTYKITIDAPENKIVEYYPNEDETLIIKESFDLTQIVAEFQLSSLDRIDELLSKLKIYLQLQHNSNESYLEVKVDEYKTIMEGLNKLKISIPALYNNFKVKRVVMCISQITFTGDEKRSFKTISSFYKKYISQRSSTEKKLKVFAMQENVWQILNRGNVPAINGLEIINNTGRDLLKEFKVTQPFGIILNDESLLTEDTKIFLLQGSITENPTKATLLATGNEFVLGKSKEFSNLEDVKDLHIVINNAKGLSDNIIVFSKKGILSTNAITNFVNELIPTRINAKINI